MVAETALIRQGRDSNVGSSPTLTTTNFIRNIIMMRQVGVTPEGVKVVANTFKIFDSHGLPLDIMLELMKENNMIPDWIDFCKEAMASGWKDKTIRNRVHTALIDTYGEEYADNVLSRLNTYIEHMPD